MSKDRAVKVEKAAAARRACSAASAETVAAFVVTSGAAVTAAAARLTKVATSTVANAHAIAVPRQGDGEPSVTVLNLEHAVCILSD